MINNPPPPSTRFRLLRVAVLPLTSQSFKKKQTENIEGWISMDRNTKITLNHLQYPELGKSFTKGLCISLCLEETWACINAVLNLCNGQMYRMTHKNEIHVKHWVSAWILI